jgi:hypothetical protein
MGNCTEGTILSHKGTEAQRKDPQGFVTLLRSFIQYVETTKLLTLRPYRAGKQIAGLSKRAKPQRGGMLIA